MKTLTKAALIAGVLLVAAVGKLSYDADLRREVRRAAEVQFLQLQLTGVQKVAANYILSTTRLERVADSLRNQVNRKKDSLKISEILTPPEPVVRPDTCQPWIQRALGLEKSLNIAKSALVDAELESDTLRAGMDTLKAAVDTLVPALKKAQEALKPLEEVKLPSVGGLKLFNVRIPLPELSVGYGVMPQLDSNKVKLRHGWTATLGYRIPLRSLIPH